MGKHNYVTFPSGQSNDKNEQERTPTKESSTTGPRCLRQGLCAELHSVVLAALSRSNTGTGRELRERPDLQSECMSSGQQIISRAQGEGFGTRGDAIINPIFIVVGICTLLGQGKQCMHVKYHTKFVYCSRAKMDFSPFGPKMAFICICLIYNLIQIIDEYIYM